MQKATSEMTRALITGGSGLVGRALAASLARDGYRVTILSRAPELVKSLPTGVSVQHWDGLSARGWGFLADGAGAIINLAGENIGLGRWTKDRKRRIQESRVNAGEAVVEAVRAATSKPRVLVQASGIGYYGPHGEEQVTEETLPGNDFLARIAVDWEASTTPVEAMGVRRVIIRTGAVLSTEGGALPRMLLPFRLFLGGPMGDGRQYLPWIHIADEVAAIRFLIENEQAKGPFNLVAPVPLTNAKFTRLLASQIRRPGSIPFPAAVLRLLFGEMSTVILNSQRAIPQRLLQSGFIFQFPGVATALEDLLG